jgi:hypothetical protein
VRRTILISFAAIVWAGTFAILYWIGPLSLVKWVGDHLRIYYYQGVPMYGSTILPCTRTLPEISLGIAMYGQVAQPGAILRWPFSLVMLITVMIPFLATAVVFGRGWCGWMCFFGGTAEVFMSGTKRRWTQELKRWFCIFCPVGAMIGLVESLSPFRVKIDKNKCDKCYDCMRACPMYAMTPKSIEEK